MNMNDDGARIEKKQKLWKNKQFKGRCRNCGKYGRKAVDCPEKRDERKPLKKVKCWRCGEFGHYANKCPNRKEKNLFVGNVLYESDDELDNMVVMYDSDDEDEECSLIGEDNEDET